ncbi:MULTISPECIES: twin-arginine translocase TatA/TatE family subunit [Chelatococcus]|uniref:Sec-independent protein translocase protein TatA n=1 Tax=Chelatococcus caeni TaxID=1348468 RepID=A0A840BVD8_9HYPH|nr:MULTISPECIES: twin-arginine translocase TatA/TatE family subunit [Chelatococcus]ALA19229.1 preprotein translocase subunit TatA [Chelatococcus sp. CO-6]MBB4016533.1 sec-independent protein translocase protein TatA [Chelatococcus caeni]
MGGASIWHWIVVGLVVLLLFGRGKISEMMGDVAKGIKAFKKGMAEDDTSEPAASPASDKGKVIEHKATPTAEVDAKSSERKAG